MRFALDTAVKTIKRKPFRAVGMALLVLLLSFTLSSGAYTVLCLQGGLSGYKARLGADIIVVPSSARGHGSVDDILLQGITGNYYMSGKSIDKVLATDGIKNATTQFFLTSAKASCCSSRVQIIGFDPETDFTVMPWIKQNYKVGISDGDLVAGANISVPFDRIVTFYGREYRIVAQLERTGTGLDSAVYVNMNTVQQMARDASSLLETSPFKGLDISSAASVVLINVEEDYDVDKVTDDINIHITKVEATSSRSMITNISDGLSAVSRIIGMLIIAVWALATLILVLLFALISNERTKEFGIYRVMGASIKMLFRIICSEMLLISASGSLIGLIIFMLTKADLVNALKASLDLPFFAPSAMAVAAIMACTFLLAVLSGIMTALFSSRRITGSETGLLIKEDT